MDLLYRPVTPDDYDAAAQFIAADSYPHNGVAAPSVDQARAWFSNGTYDQSLWILLPTEQPIGLLHCEFTTARTAEIHIRLHSPYRGTGLGRRAIHWLTTHLFHSSSSLHRIEGWTRADNWAMRSVFQQCGYVKEAHLRLDFPTADGGYVDKVGYAILRQDWQTGMTTPVQWNDTTTRR